MANVPACAVGVTFFTIHHNSLKFYMVINSWGGKKTAYFPLTFKAPCVLFVGQTFHYSPE